MTFSLGSGSPATQAAYQQKRAHNARKGEVSFSYMLVIYKYTIYVNTNIYIHESKCKYICD